MRTAKGNTYAVLLTAPVDVIAEPDGSKIAEWASDVISRDVIPSTSLSVQLKRIEQHREHLKNAFAKVRELYIDATVPQTRNSAADKGRREPLEVMPDSMLKSFAALYLSKDTMDDVIFPDDRDSLIGKIVEAMKNKESKSV